MNYIYDIVLNYFSVDDYYEFYEWKKGDSIINIEKIPIVRINSMQLQEINNYRIKVSNKVLEEICNKTVTDRGCIRYSMLVTDNSSVLGLKFNEYGEVVEKSSLLFDEEDAVIDEASYIKEELLEYKLMDKYSNDSFLTRKEKYIRKYLLKEIKYLYNNKLFDEIDYLYNELFEDRGNITYKYKYLIDDITNNYNSKYNKIYDIIRLTQ